MTENAKSVEPTKGGSPSVTKKNHSAKKQIEPAPAEDATKSAKNRPVKITSILVERGKQNGGKLTWTDLDKIIQSLGMSNDTDEIEEILSICEHEGIKIIDEEDAENDYVDDAAENPDAAIAIDTSSIEHVEPLNAEAAPETSAEDEAEVVKPTVEIDLIPDSVSIDDPVRMYLKEI